MFKGVLKKMITEMGTPIRYFLNLDNDFIAVSYTHLTLPTNA